MEIHHSEFIGSYVSYKDTPKTKLPEYAFIGRSNVGKSSLINLLTERKKLAHTSSKPGKTQCLNFFLIDSKWYIVDLPGYGYAKTAKKSREKWHGFTKDYLLNSQELTTVFLLIDSRLNPQKLDIDFANWMGEQQVPFALVFTKSDKVKDVEESVNKFETEMLKYWEQIPPIFVSSSTTKVGRKELLHYIDTLNKRIKKQEKP